MTAPPFVPPDAIRADFSAAMSAMYRREVPLYGELIGLVAAVNAAALAAGAPAGDAARLDVERHGAIRVGTGAELAILRRLFAAMGMQPVGYYDLARAGLPVHSTAFRPGAPEALARSPFRIFTSLLRLDLVEPALRDEAAALLARRRIVPETLVALIERHERDGGLGAADAARLVAEGTAVFRWRDRAAVDLDTFRRFKAAHPLIADVVCFAGPHINHLTPRVLDIAAAQAEMKRRGIPAKARIEGPPARGVPILLRQTSFHALAEPIRFGEGAAAAEGSHTARFGEIEQRGAALTPAGRALYDRLLDAAGEDADEVALAAAFAAFPDDVEAMRAQGLAYFRYLPTDAGRAAAARGERAPGLADLVGRGWAAAAPITYEDFLPVSAAGIFRSNLAGEARPARFDAAGGQAAFEAALGTPVLDPFALYEAVERASVAALAGLLAPAAANARG